MQAMTEHVGDVDAVIDEMKLRASVATDTQLAAVIGTSQSNISTWRKRGAVPKAVLRTFDQRVDAAKDQAPLHVASLMVAYGLAAHWLDQIEGSGEDRKRWLVLITLAAGHGMLTRAIKENILKYQGKTKLSPMEIAEGMLGDEAFLEMLRSWLKSQPLGEIVMQSI